jgi:hypothetical protein
VVIFDHYAEYLKNCFLYFYDNSGFWDANKYYREAVWKSYSDTYLNKSYSDLKKIMFLSEMTHAFKSLARDASCGKRREK